MTSNSVLAARAGAKTIHFLLDGSFFATVARCFGQLGESLGFLKLIYKWHH
jgi:hypothetical protein